MRSAAKQPQRLGRILRDERAFTLLVVSVVLFVLALAATFAVPAWRQSQRLAAARATAAQLKQFANVFQDYAHQHGDWPASTSPGTYPPGMEAALAPHGWTKPAPLGGRYVWFRNTLQTGERFQAAIAVVSVGAERVTTDPALLTELTHAIADPRFRLGFRREPVLVLEH